jgi:hypothetical protein
MASLKQNPFIITQSSFSGAGQWGMHAETQNEDTWEYLMDSIAGMLHFSVSLFFYFLDVWNANDWFKCMWPLPD